MFVDLSTQIWALIKIWANLSTQTWALVTLLPKSEQLKPAFFLTHEKKSKPCENEERFREKKFLWIAVKISIRGTIGYVGCFRLEIVFPLGRHKTAYPWKNTKVPVKNKVVWKILNLWTYKQIIARRKNIQNVKTSFHRHFSFSRKKSNAA